MNPVNYLTLVASIANFLLGFLVFLRNPKKTLNIVFGLYALGTSLWCATNFVFWINHDITIFRAQYAFGSIVIIAGALWIDYLRRGTKLYRDIILSILLLIMFVVPFWGGLVVQGLSFTQNDVLNFIPGSLFDIYSIILNVSFAYLIYVTFMGYLKTRGALKKQFSFILLGALGFGGISIIVSFILPFFNVRIVAPFDAQSSLIFVAASSYAIIKHKFMDIRMVVARSVTYALLLGIFATFYGSTIFFAQTFLFPEATYSNAQVLLQIILAVIMAFSFQPLRRWISKATDKIFFKNAYDPEQLLDTLAHTIGATIVLIELCYKALDIILSQVKITRGLLVILTESGAIYTSQAKGYKDYPKIDAEDISKLTKDGIILYDELGESSQYKHILGKYNASIAVPLKTEGSTEGLLLLGEKESGDMYSASDRKVMEIIAPELAVAITNAKSYEKIEKFNVTLREEVKKATSELERKNEQLRELDKAKDEFISMASHQLRTPLTAIKGYLSMLLEGDAGEIKVSQYDFVNEAFNGANRMVGLINDLLNVSRMETGRFFLEPVEVDMIKLVEEEMKQLQNNAKEKKLYLKFNLKKKKIPHIWVDETKMRQVVMNFIDNALYYTTEGGVTVSLDVEGKDIVFKVEDTGIGVPKAQQKNLFTKFYRADNARHVRPDGTGLGIYLAKRVMDDHGGEIIFHSVEGKGSTFGFKMPLKSKLKSKRVTAPAPGSGQTTPAIGELAAGIGVSAEALEATQEHRPAPEIAQDKLDIAKAAGVEAPLPDSADAKDMAKEADHIKEAAKNVKVTAK